MIEPAEPALADALDAVDWRAAPLVDGEEAFATLIEAFDDAPAAYKLGLVMVTAVLPGGEVIGRYVGALVGDSPFRLDGRGVAALATAFLLRRIDVQEEERVHAVITLNEMALQLGQACPPGQRLN